MNANFSSFNAEYFLAVREAIWRNPVAGSVLFGASHEFLNALSQLTPHQLAKLVNVRMPLVVPRQDRTWWTRFLRAVTDGDRSELVVLSEEAGYYMIRPQGNEQDQ